MNSLQKKPYNPNIKKIYPTIVAPIINEDIDKISKLFILVEQGNIAEVKKYILTTRVKLNAKYNDETILHKLLMIDDIKMSESRKLDFINYLVSNGALINSYNKFNITPLHLAVQRKYRQIVKYFIDKNANIDAITNENLTPLHYATLINIDSCPEDNMPEKIIPDPEIKNINYNEISKTLVNAFKNNSQFFYYNRLDINGNPLNIHSYNDTGNPVEQNVVINPPNQLLNINGNAYMIQPYNPPQQQRFAPTRVNGNANPIQNINANPNIIPINILDYLSRNQNIVKINELIKFTSTMNDEILENIKEKIQDMKTNVNNLKTEDIIEPILKSEISFLKKKFTINKNLIDEDLDKFLNKYNVDINDYTNNTYYIEQKKIIDTIKTSMSDDIKEILLSIIDLKLQDDPNLAVGNNFSQVHLTQAEYDEIIKSTNLASFPGYENHITYFVAIFGANVNAIALDDINVAPHREPNDRNDAYILDINANIGQRLAGAAGGVYNPPGVPYNFNLQHKYKKNDVYDNYDFQLAPGPNPQNLGNLQRINIHIPNYNIFWFYLSFLIIFHDTIELAPNNIPTPLELHNLLYILYVINECVKKSLYKLNNISEKISSIDKINNEVKELIQIHTDSIKKIIKMRFIQSFYNFQIPGVNPLVPIGVPPQPFIDIGINNNNNINLAIFNFNPDKIKDNLKKDCKYEEITVFNQIDQRDYLSTFIDSIFIEYGIIKLLNDIKNKNIFVGQPYYNQSFNLLNNINLPIKIKHELIRDSIYKVYYRLILNYLNNLIIISIKTNITSALRRVINSDDIQRFRIMPLLNIYLPQEDYSFNSLSYTNEIINSVENMITKRNAFNKLINKDINIKLIEDEDYNIYDDENFNSDTITIKKINKYYPVFYSYNYEGKETNKECIIIDYGLIEDLLKAGSNINIKDQTGKTVIDYIIDAKMHYILDDKNEYIKKN